MTRIQRVLVLGMGLSFGCALISHAQTNIFDFSAGAGQDLVNSNSTVSGSLVLTADANGGAFFMNADGKFGIDNPLVKKGDKKHEFNVSEVMSLTFNEDVTLDTIILTGFKPNEVGYLELPGEEYPDRIEIPISSATFTFPAGTLLTSGQTATLYYGASPKGGFSLSQLTVISAIPEPSSLVMLALCVGSLRFLRRR